MNFIFISPAFPVNYHNFCSRLKNNMVNVLGIGDTPYADLSVECRDSLNEYYRVSSLEDYNEVFKAVAYFSFKYGKIDYLESNNEYWLRSDAKLRTDFNITGAKTIDVLDFTSKSKMKEGYKRANVPVARYKFCEDYQADLDFIKMVGFPVIVKPDVGVGALATYRISNEDDFRRFYNRGFYVPYIIEEYINGDIISLDGICDSNSNIVFADNEVFPPSIMDVVNNNLELAYYVNKSVPKDLLEIGQRVLKSFNIKKRFFHLEFFKLKEAKEGLGEIGDIVALEVNMRPPGGYTPDMINYSQSVDTYQIYADIISYDKIVNVDLGYSKYYCSYVGRRDRFTYTNSYKNILKKYSDNILIYDRMQEALASALGNDFFIAKFNTLEEVHEFEAYVLSHKN